jgi:putative endonuclease
MFYVYVLKSLKNGRHYTGSTNDIERRVYEHNSGQTKSTSKIGPFELVYKEAYSTKIEANKRERFLKTGKGREFFENYSGSVVHW